MDIAFSPCPNDTYLMYAWVHGIVGQRCPVMPHLADIQHLNEWALSNQYPVLKVSFSCVGHILNDYGVLPVGAAVGDDCGPLLIAHHPFELEELATKRVAIPGQNTTAFLLLQLLAPKIGTKRFCLYHEAPALLANDEVDAALIIHEHRFTYEQEGFVIIADLGKVWQAQHQAPVPLGCLVARRDLKPKLVEEVVESIRASLSYAHANWEKVLPYVLAHAQSLDSEAVQRHIDTYVSTETAELSPAGAKGIEQLLKLGQQAEILPAIGSDWQW